MNEKIALQKKVDELEASLSETQTALKDQKEYVIKVSGESSEWQRKFREAEE